MTVPPREDLAAVLNSVSELIAGAEDEQWSAPTPCPEWNVRLLVNHMVLGHRLFTGILRGTTTVSPGALDPSTDDALGNNPADAYRRAADDVLTAFVQPGVLARDPICAPVPRLRGDVLRRSPGRSRPGRGTPPQQPPNGPRSRTRSSNGSWSSPAPNSRTSLRTKAPSRHRNRFPTTPRPPTGSPRCSAATPALGTGTRCWYR